MKNLELHTKSFLATSTPIRRPYMRDEEAKSLITLYQNPSTTKEERRSIKEQIVHGNTGLVHFYAKKYVRHGSAEYDELLQVGKMGIVHAVEKFDLTRGIAFPTYATYWIRSFMAREMADHNRKRHYRLPVHKNDKLLRIERIRNKLEQGLGRKPTVDEVYETLKEEVKRRLAEKGKELPRSPHPETAGITRVDIAEATELRIQSLARSIDAPLGVEGDACLYDYIPDQERLDPESITLALEIVMHIEEAVRKISPPADAYILARRLGLGGTCPLTLQQIGIERGVSRERIRQIEAEALRKFARSLHISADEILWALAVKDRIQHLLPMEESTVTDIRRVLKAEIYPRERKALFQILLQHASERTSNGFFIVQAPTRILCARATHLTHSDPYTARSIVYTLCEKNGLVYKPEDSTSEEALLIPPTCESEIVEARRRVGARRNDEADTDDENDETEIPPTSTPVEERLSRTRIIEHETIDEDILGCFREFADDAHGALIIRGPIALLMIKFHMRIKKAVHKLEDLCRKGRIIQRTEPWMIIEVIEEASTVFAFATTLETEDVPKETALAATAADDSVSMPTEEMAFTTDVVAPSQIQLKEGDEELETSPIDGWEAIEEQHDEETSSGSPVAVDAESDAVEDGQSDSETEEGTDAETSTSSLRPNRKNILRVFREFAENTNGTLVVRGPIALLRSIFRMRIKKATRKLEELLQKGKIVQRDGWMSIEILAQAPARKYARRAINNVSVEVTTQEEVKAPQSEPDKLPQPAEWSEEDVREAKETLSHAREITLRACLESFQQQ